MTTNELKFYALAIAVMIFGPIIVQFYAYIKMATLAVGALGATVAIGGVVFGCAYVASVAWLKIQAKRVEVELMKADVDYRKAESFALLQQVTAIKPGHGVVITHADYPMQMQIHAMPQLATANQVVELPQLPAPMDTDIMAGIRTGNKWIEEFLFDGETLKVFHVDVRGPTGGGKTWLVLYLMSLLQQPYPKAEYWLLDPKFEGEESGWPFAPFATDFEQMAAGAQYVYDSVVKVRRIDKQNGVKPKAPAFVIVDEEDGCFGEHGADFIKPMSRIIKEGRSGWVHAFTVGQSALAKSTGMDGALFRNMARFIIGNEALAFTRNAQFTYWEKADRDVIAKQLIYLQENKRRGVLVIPPNGQGKPFVGEIPHLPKPSFSQAAKIEEASKLLLDIPSMTVTEVKPLKSGLTNEQELAICDMYLQGYTLEEIASEVLGNTGGKQNIKLLNVLVACKVELLPKHAEKLAKVKG
jgi:hypothetical protein